MPIYEYTCKSCQTRFEKLVKSMNQREQVACPECGSTTTARALSVFSVTASAPAASAGQSPGICGRCGEPGPCAMD